MKKVICLFVFLGVYFLLFVSATKGRPGINWVPFGELNELQAVSPKPILIDVYTDWCGWCKEMDRITYHHKKLVAYVNEHYYAIKFDAESKDTIWFNQKAYTYNEKVGMHSLALYLLNGQMEFPTTVFLPTLQATPAPLPGYLKAKEMEAPIKFFAEGFYQSTSFVNFNKSFTGSW